MNILKDLATLQYHDYVSYFIDTFSGLSSTAIYSPIIRKSPLTMPSSITRFPCMPDSSWTSSYN